MAGERVTGERVKVVLERSGGIVGRSLRRGLDTDDLPDDSACELRGLVDETLPAVRRLADRPAGASVGADRLTYTLEVDGPGGRTVRTFSEPVPDNVRPLVELMRKAPLLPARRDAL